MTTLGFVLLTHAKPRQTLRLVRRLNVMFNDPPIVCHHDFARCDFDTRPFPVNVRFVRPPVATAWGRFSVVRATLAGMRALYEAGDAPAWFTLLSGSDYPVAPATQIRGDLDTAGVDAFLHHEEIDPARPRRDWHVECVRRYLRKDIRLPSVNRRLRPCWRTVSLPRRLGRLLLPFSRRFRLFAGAQWFTANRRCAHILLDWHDRRRALARHYEEVHCPDESYFQSILCNQPSLRIANDNKRYTAWLEGAAHPRTLDGSNLPQVLASGCHFARKFDMDVAPAVFDALDEATG